MRVTIAGFVLAGVTACTSAPANETPAQDTFAKYSAVNVTGEPDPHAYGIAIELWQRGDSSVGFLSEYGGSVADPPAGRLDSLTIAGDSISFQVKLSLGMTMVQEQWVWTRDLYYFVGRMSDSVMAGTLRKKTFRDDNTELVSTADVNWKRDPDAMAPESFESWLSIWNHVLTVRGPRWE